MSNSKLLLSFLLLTFYSTISSFAQLEFKLELMADSTKWGVYVKPNDNINPSENTITGSGQVTLVLPTGYQIGEIENFHGNWEEVPRVSSPIENPTKDYLSYGLRQDFPRIKIWNGQETLLFTFERMTACPGELYLIDNNTDPFASLPNSLGINPGNDLGIFDSNTNLVYNWSGNYDMCAWSCLPCTVDVSSNQKVELSELEIFPNPSNGSFKIILGTDINQIDKIKIFNTLGKEIFNNTNIKSEINIDLTLSKGLYFVAFEKENKTIQTRRIIISK